MKKTFAAVALACAIPAFATPVMDMRAEDLVVMAPDLKQSLQLNANQQILWQQVETKTRNLLRERAARRERLQVATKQALEGSRIELRELTPAMDAEDAATAAEGKQLREWWLTVNDALDENQRQQVAHLLNEQLMKVHADGGPRDAPRRAEGGPRRMGGQRRGGPAD